MLYTVTVTPYRVAFVETDTSTWLIIEYVIDGLFGMDVLVNCMLAYESEDTLIVDRWMIFKNYATSWMLLDIVSSLPFEAIFSSSSWGSLIRLSKLSRIYRLIKIVKLIRLIKVLKNRNQFMDILQCFAKLSAGMERLIYFMLSFLAICHLIACCLFFVAGFNSDNIYNWVHKYGFDDKTIEEKYLASVYWTITTLCTIGYGDILPASDIERGVVIFVELSGVFIYSYTIGTITSLMADMDKRKSKLEAKIAVLQEISKKYNVSRKFYEKLKSALEYSQTMLNKERAEIVRTLPKKLAMQLNIVMNRTFIDRNKFFEDKSLKFITSVLDFIKPLRVKAREVIYRKGEFTEEMFFLKTGEVGLFEIHLEIEIPFEYLYEGDYFGDIEVFLSEVRESTAKAITFCELYTLSREELFTSILCYFEDLKLIMIVEANNRREAMQRKKDEFLTRHLHTNNFTSMNSDGSEVLKDTHPMAPPDFNRREYKSLRKTLAPTTRAMLDDNDDASIDELREEIHKLNKVIQTLEDTVYANRSRGSDPLNVE